MRTDIRTGIIRTELCHIDNGTDRILKDTISYFRDVVSYLIHVSADHYPELGHLSSTEQLSAIEKLIHKTKYNPDPEYKTFDVLFYKYPSYCRRAAIHAAVGHVASHETRCDQYYEERAAEIARGRHYRKMAPAFTYTPNACPTLYQDNAFLRKENTILIKARVRNTWDWIEVCIPTRDLKCLQKAILKGKVKNPKLVYEYGKFYLHFPVVYKCTKHPDVALEDQTVLGTDLGLNNGAVCSLVDSSGTVHKRYFSPFKRDMDLIDRIINKIRKAARMSGTDQKLSKLYTKLQGLKDNYTRQLARWIVNRAIESRAYGIALEHLSRMKGRGSLASRTHHWCTARIRDYIKGMAFRAGIRVFIINPRNTSALAYDGSGTVIRDKDNYSMCTFQSGKRYNCDLSASYNIAARYFLRAYLKSTPATDWSTLTAKVPELSKRTRWTLSTLRALHAEL